MAENPDGGGASEWPPPNNQSEARAYDDQGYRNSPIPSSSTAAGAGGSGGGGYQQQQQQIQAADQYLHTTDFQQVYQVSSGGGYEQRGGAMSVDYTQPSTSGGGLQHLQQHAATQMITINGAPVQILQTGGAGQQQAQLRGSMEQQGGVQSAYVSVVPDYDQQQQQQQQQQQVYGVENLFREHAAGTAAAAAGSEAAAPMLGENMESEADPMPQAVTLTLLQHGRPKVDSPQHFMTEADTTQEEDDEAVTHQQQQQQQQQHYQPPLQHYDSSEAFAVPSSSHTSSAHSTNNVLPASHFSSHLLPATSSSFITSSHLLPSSGGASHTYSMCAASESNMAAVTVASSGVAMGSGMDIDSTIADSRMVAVHMQPHHEQYVTSDPSMEAAAAAGHYLVSVPPGGTQGEQGDVAAALEAVRKSARIAERERSVSPSCRPTYLPREYNVKEIWCNECQDAFPTECEQHKLQPIHDKIVLSRAWASLPPMLQILRQDNNVTQTGVYSKRAIAERTQFGPFVAELLSDAEQLTEKSRKFPLQIFRGDSTEHLEMSDENKCNWMMFVRPAENYQEQNVVVYQHGYHLYFTVTREIEAKQELKVWYSAHYAHKMQLPTHEMSEMDQQVLRDSLLKHDCYECGKRFKTQPQLHQHLAEHEDDDVEEDEHEIKGEGTHGQGEVGSKFQQQQQQPGEGKRSALARLPILKQWKKLKSVKRLAAGDEGKFQSWKKKKTNMYLNRVNKYKKPSSRQQQSMKTLYKRKGKASGGGGQEWVCRTCELTFDNLSLLNLHTLTHAAEDIKLGDEFAGTVQATYMENGHTVNITLQQPGQVMEINTMEELPATPLCCPVCDQQFATKKELIVHASEHGTIRSQNPKYAGRAFKCKQCWKHFSTEERRERHQLTHGAEESKPYECHVCHKRVMNPSALACHMKTHSSSKYYKCPLCLDEFDQVHALKKHTDLHEVNGEYQCPQCDKKFSDFPIIRKHMKSVHAPSTLPCEVCGKSFARPDKLKLHMLKHSNVKEFMCHACGRQFKRKDKLKEHVKRMHDGKSMQSKLDQFVVNLTAAATATGAEGEQQFVEPPPPVKKAFTPKVLPTEYHRFIYKCHPCQLGFKRRGMLVNHLAKRHPDQKPDDIPELTMPILRTQKDYYCTYCEKVYKSSSKRKNHIIRNHPGAELPPSARAVKPQQQHDEMSVEGDLQQYSALAVSRVTTMPHPCQHCHKQYASRAKLLQHQRRSHPEFVPPPSHSRSKQQFENDSEEARTTRILTAHIVPQTTQTVGAEMDVVTSDDIHAAGGGAETIQTDLLTQAMSELNQTFTVDYRGGGHGQQQQQQQQQGAADYQVLLPQHNNQGDNRVLQQIQQGATTATIDLGQLGLGTVIQQGTTIQGTNITIINPTDATAASTAIPGSSGSSPTSATTGPCASSGVQTYVPISVNGQTLCIPKAWASTQGFTMKYEG